MKIVVTIDDSCSMINVGSALEKTSAIIDIPEKNIPSIVFQYLADMKKCKELRDKGLKKYTYKIISFSLLQE